jgi:hypothetical protein
MNLEFYIKQLLFNYDCVIIPNFGGIVAQPIGATIHATQQVFYAPKKQLAFNKNLNKSDGLLVNSVALSKNISYQESALWIEDNVNVWLNELKNNGKLTVAEVGRFFYDKDQNILFEPATFVNYNTESYGCNSFQAAAVIANGLKQKPQPRFVELPKTKQARKLMFKKVIPYAIALPLFAVAFYIPTQTNFLKSTQVNLSSFNPFVGNSQVIAKYSERIPVLLPSLETINIENNNSSSVTSANESTAVSAPNNNSAASDKNKFHLIVGSFSTQENATDLVNNLNKNGFKAYIQGTSNNGLIRVSCNGFASKEEATQAKLEARQKGVEAWLLQE